MAEHIMDTTAHPDDELVKEVFAHFGLCMYLAQVFETGLINILTALERAKLKDSSPETFDRLYKKYEELTFGNLMQALAAYDFLPKPLVEETHRLKSRRDYLAHRFFRDHDLDFVTIAGCYVMIEKLSAERERFSKLDASVSAFVDRAYEKIGLDSTKMREALQRIEVEMRLEAVARYKSPAQLP